MPPQAPSTFPRRRLLAGLVLLGAGAGLSSCGGGGTGTEVSNTPPRTETRPSGEGGGKRIGCTIPTFNHPFFVAMKRGLEEEARLAGATLNVVDGKNDAQEQLRAIDTFVVQRVDAIILCPTETETLGPGVEKANSAGIPVITVNRTVARGTVVTYVGADDVEGGRLQGRALVEALPEGGDVLLMQGVLGSSPQRDRERGLEEVLRDHPSLRIVQKVPYDFERSRGVSVVETALTQFPRGKLHAIVAQSDDGALAAADVCGQKGRTEIVLVGFNGESDAFASIRAGKMTATVLQDAETQGREAIRATLAHLRGEAVQNPIITPLFTVTRENLDQYRPAWESSAS